MKALFFKVRNTLKTGDVIEFLLPLGNTLSTIRLCMNRFINYKSRKEKEKMSAGQGNAILIPFADFDRLSEVQIRATLPELTVARVEMFGFSEAREEHIRVRQMSLKMEQGIVDATAFLNLKKEISEKREPEDLRVPSTKPLVSKEDACCGRGCNGCLKFWNDDKYARARELLLAKNDGSRLRERG